MGKFLHQQGGSAGRQKDSCQSLGVEISCSSLWAAAFWGPTCPHLPRLPWVSLELPLPPPDILGLEPTGPVSAAPPLRCSWTSLGELGGKADGQQAHHWVPLFVKTVETRTCSESREAALPAFQVGESPISGAVYLAKKNQR